MIPANLFMASSVASHSCTFGNKYSFYRSKDWSEKLYT